MKKITTCMFGLVLALALADCKKDAGETETQDEPEIVDGRWVINGGGTVTDRETGLTWQQEASEDGKTPEEAARYCRELELGGKSHWRVPKIQELRSLIDGCPRTELGGACAVTDPGCLENRCACPEGGYVRGSCNNNLCRACDRHEGPGDNGCYWTEGVWGGWCDDYFSSSRFPGHPDDTSGPHTWRVSFDDGWVHPNPSRNEFMCRCVHD